MTWTDEHKPLPEHTMTLLRLTDIEQRADAATDGPWKVVGPPNPGPNNDLAIIPMGEVGAVAYVQPLWDDAEFIAASRAVVPALTAAIRAVLELHAPIEALNTRNNRMQRVCTGCGTDDGNWQTWPCPTVRAITEHLDVKP